MIFLIKYALTCATNIKNQAMQSIIVIAEEIHSTPLLPNPRPMFIVAIVKPTFGKIKAHQVKLNFSFHLTATTTVARRLVAKNQNPNNQSQIPTQRATVFRVSTANGFSAKYPYSSGIACDISISANAV